MKYRLSVEIARSKGQKREQGQHERRLSIVLLIKMREEKVRNAEVSARDDKITSHVRDIKKWSSLYEKWNNWQLMHVSFQELKIKISL